MPTYEYACSACNNEWEFEQSIKDDPIKECPKCHEQTARRQISRGTGFILKGSGWYSDLYSSSSNKKPEPSDDKPSGTKPSSDTSSSTDSSSAAKSESTSTSTTTTTTTSPAKPSSGGDGTKGSAAAA